MLTSSEITKKLLDETITISNEAEADLIVITGDFVQFAPEPSEHLAQDYLSQLQVFNITLIYIIQIRILTIQ